MYSVLTRGSYSVATGNMDSSLSQLSVPTMLGASRSTLTRYDYRGL